MSELTQAFDSAIENGRKLYWRTKGLEKELNIETLREALSDYARQFPAPLRAPTVVVAVRCHYCSKHVHPEECRTIGESARMCFACQERHVKEVAKFVVPDTCQGCNISVEALMAMSPIGEKFSMFAHWKDGVYQMLCRACDAVYVSQRADLFGETQHGWDRKLK